YDMLKQTHPGEGKAGLSSAALQEFLVHMPTWRRLSKQWMVQKHKLEAQKKRLDEARVQEKLAAERIKSQIQFGVICSIIFLVIVTIAFLNDITKRLSLLVSNAQSI